MSPASSATSGAAARELEHGRAPEAIADGRNAREFAAAAFKPGRS
jgi:hypothetical protein